MLLIYRVALSNVRGGSLPYRDTLPSPLPPTTWKPSEELKGLNAVTQKYHLTRALQAIKSLKTIKSDFETGGIRHFAGATSSIQKSNALCCNCT